MNISEIQEEIFFEEIDRLIRAQFIFFGREVSREEMIFALEKEGRRKQLKKDFCEFCKASVEPLETLFKLLMKLMSKLSR
jgi:hypothetical protein